ncbi:FBD-associated F-box protein At5g60610-like isoform X2 [Punica granatum]|uniref:FBD-associated F-box protein At5g60610-like isoform X2 n=1 Tax=Punica granatum TaxID=22663 RepID=A0A6P8E625_PUNGR|nr:FBD-associated F-box protein At5g60610-like isoform X2 [Punica granatum]
MDDDDKISLLPEHVKHRILSFIPSIKEVVRTSSLSKSWLRTWRSFQVTDFDQSLILPDSAIHQFVGARRWNEYSESFVRFVDDALMRSCDGMPRFQVLATAEMAPHVDKWVGMALDYHVEELSINICKVENFPGNLLYSIPKRVLSAEFIKSLTLSGDVKFDGISTVSLPSLRSLGLSHSHIDNQMFQRLLGCCPFLEDLTVGSCSLLSEIEVSNLSFLSRVMVMASCWPELQVVRIEAPALESFRCYSPYLLKQDIGLIVRLSPSLRCLEFRDLFKMDDWFCQFLSKFPMLESLSLGRCRLLKRITISNPLLKNLSITNCDNLVDIRIDTPKLSSFDYEALSTLPSIWTENPPYNCAVGLYFRSPRIQAPSACFQELQKFLTEWSTTFGCFELTVHLYEFICEALANREENPECCPGKVQCWKHELKGAKIERVQGTQHHGPLDWQIMLSLLPTLSTWTEVCFRLQW